MFRVDRCASGRVSAVPRSGVQNWGFRPAPGGITSITAAICEDQHSQRRYVVHAKAFIDTTGDGRLGAEAGAEWIQGREGKVSDGADQCQSQCPARPTRPPTHSPSCTRCPCAHSLNTKKTQKKNTNPSPHFLLPPGGHAVGRCSSSSHADRTCRRSVSVTPYRLSPGRVQRVSGHGRR